MLIHIFFIFQNVCIPGRPFHFSDLHVFLGIFYKKNSCRTFIYSKLYHVGEKVFIFGGFGQKKKSAVAHKDRLQW